MKRHLLHAASATALVWSGAVHAQNVDYDTFEALFGEPITLSATGTAKRASEAPANITIITAEEIRRSGARDIGEILSRQAGLDVIRGGAGSPEVAIRGFNQGYSRRIQVLLDGRQVYSDYFNLTTWSSIPVAMNEIRQIEIVRGPAVALYGLNAVSGAINIVTHAPDDGEHDAVELRAGSDAYYEGEATLSREIFDGLAARISIRAAEEDQFEEAVFDGQFSLPQGGANLARVDPQRFRARGRLRWDVTDTFSLEFDGSFADNEQNDYFTLQTAADSDIRTRSLRLRADWRPGDWVLSADAYVNAVDHDIFSPGVLGDTPVFLGESRLTVGKLEASRRLTSKLTVRAAGEFRRSTLEFSPDPNFEGDIRSTQFAPSVVVDYRLNSMVTLTGAVRVDYVDVDLFGQILPGLPYDTGDAQTYTQPAANAAIVFQPTARDTFKMIYGRGAALPSLVELGGVQQQVEIPIPGVGFVPLVSGGDPGIDPNITDNFEIQYGRLIDFISGSATLSLFYQDSRGLTIFPPGPPFILFPTAPRTEQGLPLFQQLDRPEARFDTFGGEFEIEGAFDRYRWGFNYGYLNIDEDNVDATTVGLPRRFFSPTSGAVGDLASPLFEDFTSRHRINANLGADYGQLSLDLFGGWISPRSTQSLDSFTFQRVEVDGRGYLGGRLAARLTDGLTASINVNDVLDDRETQTGAFRADRRWFAALTYRW